jgi:hypothetical protein
MSLVTAVARSTEEVYLITREMYDRVHVCYNFTYKRGFHRERIIATTSKFCAQRYATPRIIRFHLGLPRLILLDDRIYNRSTGFVNIAHTGMSPNTKTQGPDSPHNGHTHRFEHRA